VQVVQVRLVIAAVHAFAASTRIILTAPDGRQQP
jgi:hypothetical protein